MIHTGVAVDKQHAGGLFVAVHKVAGHLGGPGGGAFDVVPEDAELVAQGLDLGDAVQAHELAPFARRLITQLFEAGHPRQREIGEEQKDRLQRVVASGPDEVLVRVAQQPEGEQRGQGAEHAALRNVIGGLEAQGRCLQHPQCRRHALQRAGGGHAHERLPVRHAPRTLRRGRGGRGRGGGGLRR